MSAIQCYVVSCLWLFTDCTIHQISWNWSGFSCCLHCWSSHFASWLWHICGELWLRTTSVCVSMSPLLICIFWVILFLISCIVRIYCIPQFLHKEGHLTANCKGPIDHYRKFLLLIACCICWIFENYIFCKCNIWHSAQIILHSNATSWQLQCMSWCEGLCNFPVAK